MAKMINRDLIEQIEKALRPDIFISYSNVGAFINGLEKVKDNIDALLKDGKAKQAVTLVITLPKKLQKSCLKKMDWRQLRFIVHWG